MLRQYAIMSELGAAYRANITERSRGAVPSGLRNQTGSSAETLAVSVNTVSELGILGSEVQQSTSRATPRHARVHGTPRRVDGDTAAAPTRKFRADIQALRAIAVLLVVIYHVRPGRMPGGYIGVDVFFVISGFLITGHLLKEATSTGRIKLGAFWAARARRILPASLVTIAVTVVVTAFVAPVTVMEQLGRQALASIFYVQNWVLAADAVDYSASDNEATAFQHFWSLSVEEQFYLFWPLLVFAALWFVAHRKLGSPGDNQHRRALTRTLVLTFGAVVLASFVYSIVTVLDGQLDAYFVTTTRIWELGAGGLLAVIGAGKLRRPARYALAYAGLIAIFGSAVVLTSDSPFPGIAAVPVILGTVAVILAGTPGKDGADPGLVRWDLWQFGSRLGIAQWIGDRSYSLYLWHFPVIIIWTLVIDRKIGYLDVIGMILLSTLLAHLSYQFVEQPVRRAVFFTSSTPRSLIAAVIAMALAASTVFLYPMIGGQASGDWDELAEYAEVQASKAGRDDSDNTGISTTETGSGLGAAAVTDGNVPTFITKIPAITPSLLKVTEDRNRVFAKRECVAHGRSETTPACSAGDSTSDLQIALIGDSHARMYSAAFAELAEQDGWYLRTYMHNSCPFNPVRRTREVRKETRCVGPNAETMQALLADPPDLVITTWAFNAKFEDTGAPGTPGAAGFAQYWNTLMDAGIEVLVLRDVPQLEKNVQECLADNYENPDVCARAREDAVLGKKLLKEAVDLAPGVHVADFTDVFCTKSICKPVIGNVAVYSDNYHITDTFAVSMIPRLRTAIDEALGVESAGEQAESADGATLREAGPVRAESLVDTRAQSDPQRTAAPEHVQLADARSPATATATNVLASGAATASAKKPVRRGAQAARAGSVPAFSDGTKRISPSLRAAQKDRNAVFKPGKCVASGTWKYTPTCTVGSRRAKFKVVLVGDSHARMYSTAMAKMAKKNGWQLRTYLHNRCPFSPTKRNFEVSGGTTCVGPNATVMKKILAYKPDVVVTTWAKNATFYDPGATAAPGAAGFARYWNRMEKAGIDVVVLRDVPRLRTDLPRCLARNAKNPDVCAEKRSRALLGKEVFRDATSLAPKVTAADFTDAFCTKRICKGVIGNVPVYTDNYHITDTFAISLIPRLQAKIDEAVGRR